MAKHHGKDSTFSIDAVDLTTFLDSITMPEAIDVAETSTMGQDAKTYIEGMSSGTISLSGRWDETASTGPDAVLSGLKGGGATVFVYGPAGDASGAVTYTGDAILTGYSRTSPIGDVVAFTADFQITGPVAREIVAP